MAPSKYITLISQEGFEFVMLRESAMVSPLIRRMLDPRSQFLEAQTGRCHFREIKYVCPSRRLRRPTPPLRRG